MKIAVLSGKGGTGKTFVSVNIAACASSASYLDCDVEEPNGHLFFKPKKIQQKNVGKLIPVFDESKCVGCRKCVDFCKFNALAFIDAKPQVFTDVCHSCGGCVLVCPYGAITEEEHEVGHIERGMHKNIVVISGFLNIGEASGVPVIKSVLDESTNNVNQLTIIDCPPGSACTVMESVESADYCILVAEPTTFGVHNFEMVYELVQLLKKPCGVVINKAPLGDTVLDTLCVQHAVPVLGKIPYRKETALMGAKGSIAVEEDAQLRSLFTSILNKIVKELAQ